MTVTIKSFILVFIFPSIEISSYHLTLMFASCMHISRVFLMHDILCFASLLKTKSSWKVPSLHLSLDHSGLILISSFLSAQTNLGLPQPPSLLEKLDRFTIVSNGGQRKECDGTSQIASTRGLSRLSSLWWLNNHWLQNMSSSHHRKSLTCAQQRHSCERNQAYLL